MFGRTGAGVSSLINLISGYPISNDHPNARTCTRTKPKAYPPITFPWSDKQFCLYEVPGFCGQSPDAAILEAIREIDHKEGIDLFIYCLRKLENTVLPGIVRHIRESAAGPNVPMIAVVTELERFEAEEMEDWWNAPLGDGDTNGTSIERKCFKGDYVFNAHACITTLPPRDMDLVDVLRKRREISEGRIRRLIVEHCAEDKRPAFGEQVRRIVSGACQDQGI
ncbi:hypothetical protein HD554DRAFT_2037801 [Boletus coccyginus]|nr:hypothetical protein HD554DRAFT_2037801 [Boletus coccyginus]